MPDDIADNTVRTLEDAFNDLEDLIKEVVNTVKPLPDHINTLLTDVASLKLLQAARELPITAKDELEHAGKVVGSAGETAVGTVETVPAAATDVIEDVQGVTGNVSKDANSIWKHPLKKRAR
jgi:hypothetical protein